MAIRSSRDFTLLKHPEYQVYRDTNNPKKLKAFSESPYIKRANIEETFTLWELKEFEKCRKDYNYFFCNYLKTSSIDVVSGETFFEPYEFQKNIIDTVHNNRFVIAKIPRQCGKTVTICAYILWYSLFHLKRYSLIIGNKGETSKLNIAKIKAMLESLPFFLQQGCIELNKTSIQFDNGSRIVAENATVNAGRGKSINLVFWDECAMTPNSEELYTSIFPTISSGKTSKVIIVSTPKGLDNKFYKLWTEATNKQNLYIPIEAKWYDNPLKDQEWADSQLKQLGRIGYNQEVLCDFLGSSDTLIDGETLSFIGKTVAEKALREDEHLFVYEEPIKGHSYVLAFDTSEGVMRDYSCFSVIDISVSPFKQVCVFRNNEIHPLFFPEVIVQFAKLYNDAYIIGENNSVGMIVCNAIYNDYGYNNFYCDSYIKNNGLGLKMIKNVRTKGCSNLKALLETNNLLLKDFDTYSELSNFERKKDGTYKGASTSHDDLVMCLVIFSWFTDHIDFKSLTNINMKEKMFQNKAELVSQDYMPLGILGNYSDYMDNNPLQILFFSNYW